MLRNLLQKIFIEQTVSRLSLRPAHVVLPDVLLSDALRLMREHGGCLFIGKDSVGANGSVHGIITERDVVTRVGSPNLPVNTTPVSAVMTAQPKAVKKSSSIARAVQLMSTGGCRHLLVDNGAGVPPSVFSTQEAVDFLYKNIAQQVVSEPSMGDPGVTRTSRIEKFFQDSILRLSPNEALIVPETLPLSKVLQVFVERRVGSVVIANAQGAIKGIFTERDYLMKASLGECDLTNTSVVQLMTKHPQSILQSGSVALAFSIMSQGGFRHLLVVDHMEKLQGMISTRSLLVNLSQVIIAELNKSKHE